MVAFGFVAYGQPAPQGSKRHVGKGVMVESSKAVKPWRESVLHACLERLPQPWEPLDGPLAVRMVFTLARPGSAPKRELVPYRQPDLSKLARSTEDAMSDAGVWTDDARVADYHRLAKVWWGHDSEALPWPGVVVAVAQIVEGQNAEDDLWNVFGRLIVAESGRREGARHAV